MSGRTVRFATPEWFEMVGETMCEAASRARLPASLLISLVERYSDGLFLADGHVQGIRFDISSGIPSFKVGVLPQEKGDITITITTAAARRLNSVLRADPAYNEAIADYLASGEMEVNGNPERLGAWLEEVHDRIVNQTQ